MEIKVAETFYNSLPASLDNPMAQLFKDLQAVMKSRSKSNISQRLENILEVNIEKQMNLVNNKLFSLLQLVQPLRLLDYLVQFGG